MARPEMDIDWKKAESLMIAGCSGIEVAARLGIQKNTFYSRIEKDFGISYQDYRAKMKSKGDSLLREAQFAKAMKQDNMMLIWLGKNRLDQTDAPKQDISLNETNIDQTLDMAKIKSENLMLKEALSNLGWKEIQTNESLGEMELQSERDQNESKTRIEYIPGEQTP